MIFLNIICLNIATLQISNIYGGKVNLNRPKVSIITPTFNHERFIAECIDSVIDQTFKDWEMIIIDDGSTDRTPNIISEYEDDRIIYIRQENKGPYKLGETYNKALSLSNGDFIAILEGDDFWPPKKLEYQLPLFRDDDVILSHGSAKFVFDYEKKLKVKKMHSHEIKAIVNNEPMGTALYGLLGVIGTSPLSVTTIYRKSALLDIGGFYQPDCVPLIDNPTAIKMALKGKFKYLPKTLGYYRRHSKSIINLLGMREMDIKISKFHHSFIQSNSHLLADMGIDLSKFENLTDDETKNKFGLIYQGREFLELGEFAKAKEIFKNSLKEKDKNDPYTNTLLLYFGFLCAYTHINFLDILIGFYARIDTLYRNFRFKYMS